MASEKITALIEEVKGLTVLELSELVHALEDEFGVSAAAMAAPAAPSTVTSGAVGTFNLPNITTVSTIYRTALITFIINLCTASSR